ncbi:MAG: hypothetical protein AAGI38_02920 [Bacteroidota bacterium]
MPEIIEVVESPRMLRSIEEVLIGYGFDVKVVTSNGHDYNGSASQMDGLEVIRYVRQEFDPPYTIVLVIKD